MNALNTESKDNTVEKESKIQTKLVECVQTLYISDNVDEAINRLLQIIGEFYNAERCYIFEFDNDMNIIHNTYEWCAQGVESELEMLKNVEMSVIERWLYYFETPSAARFPLIPRNFRYSIYRASKALWRLRCAAKTSWSDSWAWTILRKIPIR